MTELKPRQVLAEVQYALNRLPNMRLQGAPHGTPDTYSLAVHVGKMIRHVDSFLALSKHYRDANPPDFIDQVTFGEGNTKTVRKGDQVPGMPGAICHACGLGRPCNDPDCPNAPTTCDE